MPGGLMKWIGAFIGFVMGVALSTFSMWDEVFRRLENSRRGIGGESSDVGEPLFYIVIFGTVPGIVGALIVGVLFHRVSGPQRKRPEYDREA